jgi:CheY-like chemotaxis protein
MASLLVIDDDELFLEMLHQILQRAGHRVRTAGNGTRCLELIESERVDVLITDIFMPEADGIETIRRVRQHSPALKIVAISGGGSQGTSALLRAARMFGADETLGKPFHRAELLAAVGRCLSSEPDRDAADGWPSA